MQEESRYSCKNSSGKKCRERGRGAAATGAEDLIGLAITQFNLNWTCNNLTARATPSAGSRG